MRKLVAVLSVFALMIAMMVPAFAAPSIGKPTVVGEEAEPVTPVQEGRWVEVRPINSEAYENKDVAQIVERVNDALRRAAEQEIVEDMPTVRETVEFLADYLPDGTTLDKEEGIVTIKADEEDTPDTVIDLNEYDFVTEYQDLVLTDGKEAWFDDNGEDVVAKVKLKIDALKGETDLSKYLIMMIKPNNGEVYFVDVDPETLDQEADEIFDSETGEIIVEFPCLGTFSLIQK